MNEPLAHDVPTFVIRPSRGLRLTYLKELWEYRELLYFLVWRDIKVRYKQTVIGAAWAILQPVMTMVLFSVVFGNFAKIPSDGLPYPIFAYSALVPWAYFADAMSRGGTGIVDNMNLVSKIYFPRLIIPLSAVTVPLVDFALSFVVLTGMMAWFGVQPTWGIIILPLFLGLALITALSVMLWLSALNVRYRDVRYTIPFLVQVWLYASPVAYPISIVPEKWRLLYSINPMVGVIEGFRWALLGKTSPDFHAMLMSGGIVALMLIGGIIFFYRTEQTFADVI